MKFVNPIANIDLKKKKFILIFILFVIIFLNLGNFLDISVKPARSDLIVSLGGGRMDRIKEAIDLYSKGYSSKKELLLMGDKHQITWKISKHKDVFDKAKNMNILYTKALGNTMEELNYIDKFMASKQFKSVLIVTDPYHSRRVDLLIKIFTNYLKNKTKYTIVSSKINWWNKKLFFLKAKSLMVSISESSKIIYNYIKYSLPNNNIFFVKMDKISLAIKSYTNKNYGFY